MGRIIIPKGIRDRLDITEGDELEFYCLEGDNIFLIGMGVPIATDPRYVEAAQVLKELNIPIPEKLNKKINGG